MTGNTPIRGGVIVTGGSGGIGTAVAHRFAAADYGVVVNDVGVTVAGTDPSPSAADNVAEEIRADGGQAISHHGSVTDMTVAENLVAQAVHHFGRLSAVVTCHGILRERMIFNMSEEEWDSVINVHLKGTFCCFRAATAEMRRRREGSIVALTSAAGLEGSPAQANYAAAKAGIVGLTFSTALAMGKYGVNVNCIVPSARTRMTARITDKMSGTRPTQERQGPELIAELALALAEPRLRHVTGQLLTAAGSRLARWQPPAEVMSIELQQPLSQDVVQTTVLDKLHLRPLRRFAALGLEEPDGMGQAHR